MLWSSCYSLCFLHRDYRIECLDGCLQRLPQRQKGSCLMIDVSFEGHWLSQFRILCFSNVLGCQYLKLVARFFEFNLFVSIFLRLYLKRPFSLFSIWDCQPGIQRSQVSCDLAIRTACGEWEIEMQNG